MDFILWITIFTTLFTVSLSQNTAAVESCISYDLSENPMLNIKWSDEDVDLQNEVFIVLYRTIQQGVLSGERCVGGNNRTNIPIPDEERISHMSEVRTTSRDTCSTLGGVENTIGFSLAEYGYILNVDTVMSEDNSSVTFTCHLACQTDFITGCSIKIDGCGEEITQTCVVENTLTFSPRQCSVVFEDLLPTSYAYAANVLSSTVLQLEENVLNMTGLFATADVDNFSCERPSNTTDDDVPTNSTMSNENSNSTSDDNSPSDIPTIATTSEDNSNNTNDTNNPSNDLNGGINNPSNDIGPPNNGNSNATASGEGDGFLDKLESIPVPVIASVGAVILILLIVVVLLVLVFCKMRKSAKKDEPKENGLENIRPSSFTFQNSTTALFQHADSCSDVRSDMHAFPVPSSGSVSKVSGYDHLERSFQSKQSSPFSYQTSFKSESTNDSFSRSSKLAQSYESSTSTKDEELLDDFDYDEIEDSPSARNSTQYNNLVHSGKEHRLKIDCPPAPTKGTYERLSQPPPDDNYAVPPELDDTAFTLNETSKSGHEYETPPELDLSAKYTEGSSDNIPADAVYDRLSPKTDNVYDQVAKEFQYDHPTSNVPAKMSQYDTLLPKLPVVEDQSKQDLQSSPVTQQPSPLKVQHSPGPLTGDMYTVPKKSEIRSPKLSHDYDTVADDFESQSTVF